MAKWKIKPVDPIEAAALDLTILGAIDIGVLGIFGSDLISMVFGPLSMISRILYLIIGISALYSIYILIRK